MKGLAVLVLRYKQPGQREFRVPLNFKIGHIEVPLGLGLITAILFALCIVNLFTKQVATISGVAFTIIFFLTFELSEKITKRKGAAHVELDQFNLEPGEELSPQSVGVRPGNVLVMVRNYNTLYHLSEVLNRTNTQKQDIAVMHLRLLQRAASGEHELEPEQLFSREEQELFTRSLNLAEKSGKTVHLAVAPATEKWDGILRAAQGLQSSAVVLGLSPRRSIDEEARIAGLAWEALPEPKPQLTLEIFTPGAEDHVFYLGPHAPRLTVKEIDLLHQLWLELGQELISEDLHHRDVVHFALERLRAEMSNHSREEIIASLKQHLAEAKKHRAVNP